MSIECETHGAIFTALGYEEIGTGHGKWNQNQANLGL
jgi:hypothetical protein